MIIAVEGCAHGELDKIYTTIADLENNENVKVDLLICCGDFQSTRNINDLRCMACPVKYQSMCSFYKYYSGEKKAPILTIFIGGNHEASNYLQELSYGGWVAPNIYYMGYAGVIDVAGVRIGGLSGIYKGHDYLKGHFEKYPYNNETIRSVYHVRNLEVFKLKQLTGQIDVFLSHDWPRGIYNYGNVEPLLKWKPHFRDEIASNSLGSKACEDLLWHVKPSYWFAAHLHCKFAAIVSHDDKKVTKFLSLDKCLPRRKFLQIVNIPHDESKPIAINYDLEWLSILYLTNHLLSVKKQFCYMPSEGSNERWNFTPTEEEKKIIKNKFNNDLTVPQNFYQNVQPYSPSSDDSYTQQQALINNQTTELCAKLGIDDPIQLLISNESDNSFNESLPQYLTPEKEGNRTFVDSFLSPGSITENSSPVKPFSSPFMPYSVELRKRINLSLPEPKLNKSTTLSFEDDNSQNDEDTPNELFFIDNKMSAVNNDINTDFKLPISTDNDSAEDKTVKKQFKRRNASMYQDLDT